VNGSHSHIATHTAGEGSWLRLGAILVVYCLGMRAGRERETCTCWVLLVQRIPGDHRLSRESTVKGSIGPIHPTSTDLAPILTSRIQLAVHEFSRVWPVYENLSTVIGDGGRMCRLVHQCKGFFWGQEAVNEFGRTATGSEGLL